VGVVAAVGVAGASSVASRADTVRVNAGVKLVGHVGVVRTGGVASVSVVAGGGAVSVVATSQARASGTVDTCGAVGVVSASGAVTSSRCGVADSTNAVRVNTGVGPVANVGVVGTSGVRAGQAGRTVSVVAASQTGTGGAVGASGAVTSSRCGVADSTNTVRVDTGVDLVANVRVVGTSGVRSSQTMCACGAMCVVAASQTGPGCAVSASGSVTSSGGSVANSTNVVRVDTGVGLVTNVRVVGTSGVV
jgi:hypothetical protein